MGQDQLQTTGIDSMSIKLQNEVRALRDRMDELELAMNVINQEPRKVAGVSDPDPKPKEKPAKKTEG